MSDRPTPDEDDLVAFIEEAESYGMPGEIRPEDVGVTLPTGLEMLERAKAAEAAAKESAVASKPSSTVSRVRPRLGVLAMAATAAVVFGVVFVGFTGKDSAVADTPPILDFEFVKARDIAWAPGKPARTQLLRLAEAAGKQPTPAASGTTQYVASENWNIEVADEADGSSAALIPIRRESWLHADGSFTVRESSGAPLRADGRHDLSQPPKHSTKSVIEASPPGALSPDAARRLGNDPGEVRQQLLKETDCPATTASPIRADCLVTAIKILAGNHMLPPDTRRAFWQVLADEPSLRALGMVRDRESRSGVGISLIDPKTKRFRLILIISPRTGELLGTEEVLIKSDKSLGVRAPAIYRFSAFVESRETADPGPVPVSRK